MAQTSRPTTKNLTLASKAPFWRRFGFGLDETKIDDAYSNNYARKYASADGQSDVEAYRVDTDNAVRIGAEAINPNRTTINFPLATNASIVTQTFFIAPVAMEISAISCEFETTDGATNTGWVTHETGTAAAGTGGTVMIGTFNLNATAKTVQNAVLPKKFPTAGTEITYPPALVLAAGDRLSFKIASAVTSLAGLVVSIAATPGNKGEMVVYNMQANGDLITQSFYMPNRPQTIQKVQVIWGTKSSSGTSTIDVQKDTGTTAPGSGTTVLTAAVNATGTANTVATPALSATAASLTMAAGDRLSVVFAGAGQVALAGVVVVVWMTPVYGSRKDVTFDLSKNANLVTQPFFIADRDYDLIDLSEVHKTLGTDASAVTVAVTIDTGTTAAGAGLVVQTDNTNAGFSLKATINTTQVGTLATLRNRVVPAGARLSVKFAGVTTAVAGVTITVSLVAR